MAGLLAGCGTSDRSPRQGGDPGNRRLHALAASPILQQLPPGARVLSRRLVPARRQPSGFGAGGWSGPAVIERFTCPGPARPAYAFLDRAARRDGWTPGNRNALGLPFAWSRTGSGADRPALLLYGFDPRHSRARGIAYELVVSG